jgi:hypothetical protein
MKEAAATYLEGITMSGILWQSTQWLNADPCLPPRYGIVTSNTSECVNNMFAEARNLCWPDALEKILDIMSSRICASRSKYQQRDDWDVVPQVAQILKKRWDAAASLSVDELELGCGDFKVVEQTSVADDLFDDNSMSTTPRWGQRSSIHIVKPDMQWCSCGVWQEFMYPCRHGCAVYRKWKEKQFDYVLANLVHPYYKFEFVKETFRNNVFPVSLDTIEYDGVTKPPTSIQRQPGRPRTKRIRRRSEFLDPEDSPAVTCSKCGKRGHNRRTCRS